jgi:hypothetical protein
MTDMGNQGKPKSVRTGFGLDLGIGIGIIIGVFIAVIIIPLLGISMCGYGTKKALESYSKAQELSAEADMEKKEKEKDL